MESSIGSSAVAFRTLLVAGAMALATACRGSDDGPADWVAQVDTIGDTVSVFTTRGALRSSEGRLVEELAIGETLGDDEAYLFGEPTSIAVGGDGTVYVVDEQIPVIRAYDAEGRHLRDLGRAGSGPGEYALPQGIAVRSDGNVVVRDPANGRMIVFSPEGEELTRYQLDAGFATGRRTHVDDRNGIFHPIFLGRNEETGALLIRYERLDESGMATDTIVPPESNFVPERLIALRVVDGDTGRTYFPSPFQPRESWRIDRSGKVIYGIATRYAIDRIREDGTVLRVGRAHEPATVPAAERTYRRETWTRILRNVQPDWRWEGPDVASEKPPYLTFFLGVDDRIWVVLHQTSVEVENPDYDPEDPDSRPTRWDEPRAFDVFEPDGRYLGMVRAPIEFELDADPVFRGDTIWAVARDSLDVPRIVRYRVEWGNPD